MITINKQPGQRILELGGGDNRHPSSDVNVDVRSGPKTDFCADFNQPLPIATDEFDGVYSAFVIEHLSFRKVPQFVSEVLRVLKPSGKAIIVTANTEAQMEWIKTHPEGWDGKAGFEASSELIFGSQDYSENTHANYMTPALATKLFQDAGFSNIVIRPYGERNTDLCIEASKPANQVTLQQNDNTVQHVVAANATPDELYDKHYFNGGGKVGGYAREGYWDYPVHNITVQHILARKPTSVLELGCARGYILKRLQDASIPSCGLEVSHHCFLTRVADNIWWRDICKVSDLPNLPADLAFSIATFEHIPEAALPGVLSYLKQQTQRGLHGIDFGAHDDGFDQTHVTLRPKEFWRNIFDQHGLQAHEIVDKEELEKGDFPQMVLNGDGKIKLNIGSFTTMYHHGWTNIDIHDLSQFANQHRYKFERADVKQGLSNYATGSVSMIGACHFLEHLTYKEGLTFLRECRRLIKPDGAMRIIVPDAELLMCKYGDKTLAELDEINDAAADCGTDMGKFWSLLHAGHSAAYDRETLHKILQEAGWIPHSASFRRSSNQQMLAETLDMLPCISLYADATPEVG